MDGFGPFVTTPAARFYDGDDTASDAEHPVRARVVSAHEARPRGEKVSRVFREGALDGHLLAVHPLVPRFDGGDAQPPGLSRPVGAEAARYVERDRAALASPVR